MKKYKADEVFEEVMATNEGDKFNVELAVAALIATHGVTEKAIAALEARIAFLEAEIKKCRR